MSLDVQDALSPNFDLSPGRKPTFIILHGSGGREQGTVAWIGDSTSRVSYHYFLPKDGEPDTYRMVRDEDVAWHVGYSQWVEIEGGQPVIYTGLNRYSIGVAFESMNAQNEVYTGAQIGAGVQLVGRLMQKYDIPKHRVLTHKMVSDPPGRKIDPVNFPLDDFMARLDPYTHPLAGRRLFANDTALGRIVRAGEVADKLYLYTEEQNEE